MTTTNVDLRFAATLLRDALAQHPEMRGVGIGVKNNKPCLRVAVTQQTDLMDKIPVLVAGVPVVVFDVSRSPLPVEQRPVADLRLHLLSEHNIGRAFWLSEDEAARLHEGLHEDKEDLPVLSWDYDRALTGLENYRNERQWRFDPVAVMEQYFHHR